MCVCVCSQGFEKLPESMLVKFYMYLRAGPVVLFVLEYALLVGGVAFVALTVIASVYIPEDDELKYRNSAAWRRESQTLTGTPTIRVPVPAAATAAKEMNTYYSSLTDATGGGGGGGARAAVKLNDQLCDRLEVVHEVSSLRGSSCCTDSEFDDDDYSRPIV